MIGLGTNVRFSKIIPNVYFKRQLNDKFVEASRGGDG
jgi:hypothetical protein